VPNLEIFLAPIDEPNTIAGFRIHLTWDGYDRHRMPYKLSMNPLITRDMSRNSLLEIWKAEVGHQEEWWRNEYGHEAAPPWDKKLQVVFKLEPWTKENTQSRKTKRPSSSDPKRSGDGSASG
jgi:hypothetical protein